MNNDPFIKWLLSVTSAIFVVIVGGIFSTILSLREDMSVIKEQVSTLRSQVTVIENLQSQIEEHEIRIRWIEQGNLDHQSGVTVYRDYKRRDTTGVPATHPD